MRSTAPGMDKVISNARKPPSMAACATRSAVAASANRTMRTAPEASIVLSVASLLNIHGPSHQGAVDKPSHPAYRQCNRSQQPISLEGLHGSPRNPDRGCQPSLARVRGRCCVGSRRGGVVVSGARTIVVGASHWHVPLYAAAIAEAHDVVGLSDEDPARVQPLAELWDAPVDADWHRLLELPDVDLAYVFGPHDQMTQVCLALIERRIPFVVEKPLGTSLEQLQQVRRAAANAQVPATVPLIQRGGPVDRWLAKAGRPVYQRLSFIAGPPDRYNGNGNPWMLDPERAGGGCLANLGPHFVDLFLQRTANTTAEVTARLSSTLHTAAIEDHATLLLTTPDGREAIVEVGYAFPHSDLQRYCSYSSAGEAGFVSIDTAGSAVFTALDGHTERAHVDVDSDPLYDPFVRQVALTLSTGFSGMPTLGELEDAMRIIWRAYQADREGSHHG